MKNLRITGKVIGIVRSRRRDSSQDFILCLDAFLSIYVEGDIICSGGCPKGADRFAELIAKNRQVPVLIHYPQWDKHGKAAGPIRNKRIALDCDVLIALPAEDRTGGTESTIEAAEKLGRKIILV